MQDGVLVVDFLFDTLTNILNLIKSNWLLSASLLIAILALIIDLVNASQEQR